MVQLELTCRQERYTQRSVGIARFVYNRMVANDQAGRDTGLWLTPYELEKEFNAAKQVNPALAFVTEVSKFVAQGTSRNYRNAHSRWRNKSLKARKLVFHRKNRTGTGSFLAASGIACWKPPIAPPRRETQSVGRVDVGISPLAMDSDGVEYQNPKAYGNALRKLRRWQRAQARRTPGSRGWWQAQRRIDRTHRRVTGLRNNAHHHVSLTLIRKYHTMGIETLNVAGMIRAGLQSRALADAGMSSLLDQIQYKANWYGTRVIEVDQWYPSSKTCSGCGVVNGDLGRAREWECPNCGTQHDRNQNAARNLLKLALLAVGGDVTLPDGEALAGGDTIAGETAPNEGRTKPMTTAYTQPRLVL